MKQISFATAEHQAKKRVSRREKFLVEINQVVPWQRLIAAIDPYYLAGKRGRRPIGLERMLRLYFVQQWCSLADEALEVAVSDSAAIRNFVGIDVVREEAPDATTVLKFRRLLETAQLTERIFDEINADLIERCLLIREGTTVDATIINAPSSVMRFVQYYEPLVAICVGYNLRWLLRAIVRSGPEGSFIARAISIADRHFSASRFGCNRFPDIRLVV
jgi:IS5 family transposase